MSNKPYIAPSVILPNETGQIVDLKNFRPNPIVLFFYPRDNTSGCTREAKDFTEKLNLFDKAKVNIFGISKDSIESHKKFKNKYKFPFDLLSDEDLKIIKTFKAWGEKKLFGKKYMGVKRTTILINKKLKIMKIWNNVKVKGHVDEVLDYLKKTKK